MSRDCKNVRFRARGRKLCRASAGIQSFGLQCFVSDRVAVEVSVPLLVPLALFIVGCDSSRQAIRSRWSGSALARLRCVALGRAASDGLGTSEDEKQKHWALRWATFLVTSSETSSKRQLRPAFATAQLPQQAAQPGIVVRFGDEVAAFRQLVGGRSHFA